MRNLKIIIISLLTINLYFSELFAKEPFVVLEHSRANSVNNQGIDTVSYTHLTLPTKRIV